MSKMGCGCELGCDCEDCAMGCGCSEKGLGARGDDEGIIPIWFVLGGAAGVGIWYLFKNMGTPGGPGVTVAAPMPTIAPPSRFANLQSIALRLDQLKTLYRSGYLSPEQAIAESEGLIGAANSFSLQEGERVNEIVPSILAFEVEVEDYIKLKRELVPAASGSPRVSAFV